MQFMKIFVAPLLALTATGTMAAEFTKGPLISQYGAHAEVKQTQPLSGKESFKVAFDVAEQGETGKVNRKIESLARFLNMHTNAGIPAENIQLALVVHGKAGFDLLDDANYKARFDSENPNAALLEALLKNKVRIIICGQSAAYHGIENSQLVNGVEVALSAMTAHALLQQQGYTVNPF
ncbi:Intracellular sulfur oxidation protein, DsrE/DsrF family [Microbulbifer donghaiensis]|uniref:Intracellular sulfur oxidation protein, DsrE/DsrF family n=1 Tax=Microbulbifer donghaiensis TaxID=494016 RepID=A0A1M5D635_9GAMM|nr:DsrE family protein [Microbulbifer donghaiensis]SHF62458.1 Intracellular sulfur oxidation protein, DsrE/DsrF family [Microbulbifer donghaiensis]